LAIDLLDARKYAPKFPTALSIARFLRRLRVPDERYSPTACIRPPVCGTVVDMDLRVKSRDPEASVSVALRDVRCPRCNGYGRPRIIALARHPSI
jgi:hypothetical protein